MAQIPLYDAETDELVNEAALKKQEDERLRQRPRKSITEMRLAGGLAGGEFMRDYTSTPEYRQRAIRKSLERAQSVGEQNLATTEKRLSEQKASLDAEQRADEQQVQAGVERAINDAFQRAYEENKAMGLSEEAALVMGRQAANDARAFFESSTAGTPVQLQRPVDDPVASGEAMQQALEQKYAGLESLHGARISQLRGLGSQLEEQYAAERGSALAEQSVLARQTEDETDIRRAYREQEKARIETENVNRQIRAKAKEKTQLDIDEAVGEVVNFKIDPKRFY